MKGQRMYIWTGDIETTYGAEVTAAIMVYDCGEAVLMEEWHGYNPIFARFFNSAEQAIAAAKARVREHTDDMILNNRARNIREAGEWTFR